MTVNSQATDRYDTQEVPGSGQRPARTQNQRRHPPDRGIDGFGGQSNSRMTRSVFPGTFAFASASSTICLVPDHVPAAEEEPAPALVGETGVPASTHSHEGGAISTISSSRNGSALRSPPPGRTLDQAKGDSISSRADAPALAVLDVKIDNSTPGLPARNSPAMRGNKYCEMVCRRAQRYLPPIPRATSSWPVRPLRQCRKAGPASSNSSWPAGVRAICCPVRSKRRNPSSSSSALI